MNLVLTAIFLGTMTITAYRSIPSQTDSSPWITSIGERVNPHGIAVSPDLLVKNGGTLNYGNLLYIKGIGFKFINDVMHRKHKRSIDIWVATYKEEKRIGIKTSQIWLIKSKIKKEKLQWMKHLKKNGYGVQYVKTLLLMWWKMIL